MRIAVTRPRERSKDTISLIEDRGWEAFIVPSIEIVPRHKDEVKDAIDSLEKYDWLILTSASGAQIMLNYFANALKRIKIVAIEPKTKEMLEKNGIKVDLMPKEYTAENLADTMIKHGIDGTKILITRASIGREILVDKLKTRANVNNVHLYDTQVPENIEPMHELSSKLDKNTIDAIIFTSSQATKNLLKYVKPKKIQKNRTKICAIGPITAKTLEENGIDRKSVV